MKYVVNILIFMMITIPALAEEKPQLHPLVDVAKEYRSKNKCADIVSELIPSAVNDSSATHLDKYALYFYAGSCYRKNCELSEAVKYLEKAESYQTIFQAASTMLAFMHSTSADSNIYNPKKAMQHLDILLRDGSKKTLSRYNVLDDIAAVYAANGMWDKAIEAQTMVVEKSDFKGYRDRLESYKQHKRWIDSKCR